MYAHKSSRRRALALLHLGMVGPLVVTSACSRDELAPDCFKIVDEICVIPDPGGTPPGIDCSGIPTAAVRAEYAYTVEVGGGSGQYGDFMAAPLPAGLVIDPATGEITGIPEAPPNPGDAPITYDVVISVFDEGKGAESTATCPLTVNPPLNSLGLRSAANHCLDSDSTEQEMLAVLEGGDGTPITCSLDTSGIGGVCPLGDGNGRLPDGISFDASTCTHSGTLNSTLYGTWVWMVTLEQSGHETAVPFCASNDIPTFHEIVLTDNGGPGDPLEPALFEYDPSMDIGFGSGTHQWAINSPDCPGADCNNFGFRFAVTCSPFDVLAPYGISLSPSAGTPTGLSHEMAATGPTPNSDFEFRPWVASFEMSYCTSADGAFCVVDDVVTFEQNAQTKYHYDVVGYPTP